MGSARAWCKRAFDRALDRRRSFARLLGRLALGTATLFAVACGGDEAEPTQRDLRLEALVDAFERDGQGLELRAPQLLQELDALVLAGNVEPDAAESALVRLDELLEPQFATPEDRLIALELQCAAAALRRSPELEVRALYYLATEAQDQALFTRASVRIDARLPELEPHAPRLLPLLHLERGSLARFESDWARGRSWLRKAEDGLQAVNEPWAQTHLYTIYSAQFGMDLELGQTGRAAEWLAAQTASVGVDNLDGRHGTALNSIKLAYFTQRFRRCVKLAAAEIASLEVDAEALGERHADYFLRVRLLEAQARYERRATDRDAGAVIESAVRETLALEQPSWDLRSDALSLQALWALHSNDHKLARKAIAELHEHRPRSLQANAASPLPACRLDALACLVARRTGDSNETRAKLLATWERSFAQFLRFWSEAPLEPDGIGFLQMGLRRFPLVEGIASSLALDPDDVEHPFNYLLQAQAQGTLSRRWGVQPPSLSEIRATLSEGEGVFALVPGPQVSHAFLLDREHLEHVTLPAERVLIAQLESLPTGRPRALGDERWKEPAQRLADLLWTDAVRARLRSWTSVAVVGTDLIGALPFAWLPLDGVSIGQTKPISGWPSIPLVVEMHRRQQVGRGAVALLAPELSALQNTTFGPLADVHTSDTWLAGMTESYAPKTWHLCSNSAATPAQFLSAAVSGTDLCYFLGHGVELPNERRPAALLLTPTGDLDLGLVRSSDIERAFADGQRAPRVAILAACGTSQAPARLGDEGLGHLGGALIASGTMCVVLSSAALDRDATMLWSRYFHQSYGAGATVAEAVLFARQSVQRDERFSHPFFHSRIRTLGLGSSRLRSSLRSR